MRDSAAAVREHVHPILIVGSPGFAARLIPSFTPRHEFAFVRTTSVSTEMVISGLIPELAILDGDGLQHDIFLIVDALARFRTAVPVVAITSHPELFHVTSAIEVVSPARARTFLSRRGQQLRNCGRNALATDSHVPLGITADTIAMGKHVAFVWRNDRDLRRLFRFWTAVEPTAQQVLVAPSKLLDHLCALLPGFGMDVRALVGNKQLILVKGEQLTNALVKRLCRIVSHAAREGAWPVRVISFSSGQDGNLQAKRFEEQLDRAMAGLPALLVCSYRIGDWKAGEFLRTALATHDLLIIGDRLIRNSFYLT